MTSYKSKRQRNQIVTDPEYALACKYGGRKRRRLTPQEVREIRSSKKPYRALSDIYGVSMAIISSIRNRGSYRDVK